MGPIVTRFQAEPKNMTLAGELAKPFAKKVGGSNATRDSCRRRIDTPLFPPGNSPITIPTGNRAMLDAKSLERRGSAA